MARGWQAQGRATHGRRRKKQQRAQRPLSEAVKPATPERPEAAPVAVSKSSGGWRQAPTRSVATIRAEEYQYVYSDLKRIAVLAVSVFAVLIALSFVIK